MLARLRIRMRKQERLSRMSAEMRTICIAILPQTLQSLFHHEICHFRRPPPSNESLDDIASPGRTTNIHEFLLGMLRLRTQRWKCVEIIKQKKRSGSISTPPLVTRNHRQNASCNSEQNIWSIELRVSKRTF